MKVCFTLIIVLINFYIFPNEIVNDNVLIKRNVLVLPFVNSNNNADYIFLNDTIPDAIKANLLNTNKFNLSDSPDIRKNKIDQGIKEINIFESAEAVKIAKALKADVVVTGKFIIIDEKIMINIQAIDVFTDETVILLNQSGNLGINLLSMIDDISKDLSLKMSDKFPLVDRSYFTEMTKLINNKKPINFTINTSTSAGIGLSVSGSCLFLGGLTLLTYDLTGYSTILLNYKNNYYNTGNGFEEFNNSYNIFIGLFISGVVLMPLGIIMVIISIPLFVYKNKTKKITLKVEFYQKANLSLNFQL